MCVVSETHILTNIEQNYDNNVFFEKDQYNLYTVCVCVLCQRHTFSQILSIIMSILTICIQSVCVRVCTFLIGPYCSNSRRSFDSEVS